MCHGGWILPSWYFSLFIQRNRYLIVFVLFHTISRLDVFFFGSLETLGKYCSGLERSGIKPRNNIGKEWPFIRNSISPRIVCIHEKRRTVGARYLYHAYLESFLYKRSMELAECTNRVQFKAQILVILWRIDFHNSYGITSKSCSATFEIDIFQNNMKCNLRWK